METLDVSTEELQSALVKVCKLGQELGYESEKWTILLGMIAPMLADAHGLEVHAKKIEDTSLN